MDRNGDIKAGNKTATDTMGDIIERAKSAKKDLGSVIREIFDGLKVGRYKIGIIH